MEYDSALGRYGGVLVRVEESPIIKIGSSSLSDLQ